MRYDFECEKCHTRTERDFRMASVPRTVECGKCGGNAKRMYNSFALGINGGINRSGTFGESVKKRNEKAGKKMRERKAPVRTVAYDYGNGDIRGV